MKKIIFLLTCIFLISCGEQRNWKDTDTITPMRKVCVEGHVYYKNMAPYNGGIAIKLDDEGKPIKCSGDY